MNEKWFWTICRETGDKIEAFCTLKEAQERIRKYEDEDRDEDIYTPDFYDIVEDYM